MQIHSLDWQFGPARKTSFAGKILKSALVIAEPDIAAARNGRVRPADQAVRLRPEPQSVSAGRFPSFAH
jgi:hypothetical protein